MFFREGSAVLNVAGGFDDGLSFWYSTTSETAFVNLWSGLDASGMLLGTIALSALGSGADPDDPYSIWSVASFAFDGLARSIDFGGTANRVGFDDVTLGAVLAPSSPIANPDLVTTPTIEQNAVPEAPTLALALAALAALGVRRHRRAG